MPDHDRPFEGERAAEPREVVGVRGDSVGLLGLVTAAIPAQVHSDDLVRTAEVCEPRRHEGVIAAPAVHEQERRLAAACLLIEQGYLLTLTPRHGPAPKQNEA